MIGSVIGETQSAFIKGRSILDGVLITNELVDYVKRGRKGSLLFKVDFEKAFDCVSWDFLFLTMECMGFGVKWRGWIHACLSSASISVSVNGPPTVEIVMTRGIRQGDLILPFLFLIVAEGLNVAMQEMVSKGLYDGVSISVC